MIHILSLHDDLLRRIPTGYRMWKLLQMTCTALNMRLGDYHAARGIHAFTDGDTEVSYNRFKDKLIEQMNEEMDDVVHIILCNRCEWIIDMNGN